MEGFLIEIDERIGLGDTMTSAASKRKPTKRDAKEAAAILATQTFLDRHLKKNMTREVRTADVTAES